LTVLCVAASRALATALSAALRTRRGRDLALLATGLVAVTGYVVLPRQRDPGALVHLKPSALTATLAVLPPGALARAVVMARDGSLVRASLLLAYGAAAVAASLALFAASLGREVVQHGDRSVVRAGDTRLPLFPRPLRWLPASPVGAVTAKELRYFLSRDPRQLQMLVFGAAVAAVTLWRSVASGDAVIGQVAAPLLVVLLGAQSLGNQFGVDADAVQHYQLTGVGMRSVLAGKNLAVLVLLLPATVAAQVAVAVLTHGFGRLPGAVLCAGGTLGVLAGFGDVLSVRAAYPIARGDARPSGRQATTALVGVIGVFCSLALAVPLLGLMLWSDIALGTNLPGGVAALALGGLAWWAGWSRAARWADTHGPELAAKLRLGEG
jgi:ABC-2 type transport system permease protein